MGAAEQADRCGEMQRGPSDPGDRGDPISTLHANARS
jgi:hypothetical protein